jgi:hypothetical protein
MHSLGSDLAFVPLTSRLLWATATYNIGASANMDINNHTLVHHMKPETRPA